MACAGLLFTMDLLVRADVKSNEKEIRDTYIEVKMVKVDVQELKYEVQEMKSDLKTIKSDVSNLKSDLVTTRTDFTNQIQQTRRMARSPFAFFRIPEQAMRGGKGCSA